MTGSKFVETVKHVVELLVSRDYEEIVRLTKGRRLTAQSVERAVREYGRTFVMPPDDAFEKLDAVLVENVVPPRWSVRVALWSLEEGGSDLTLELTVIVVEDRYFIELDDIHVL